MNMEKMRGGGGGGGGGWGGCLDVDLHLFLSTSIQKYSTIVPKKNHKKIQQRKKTIKHGQG